MAVPERPYLLMRTGAIGGFEHFDQGVPAVAGTGKAFPDQPMAARVAAQRVQASLGPSRQPVEVKRLPGEKNLLIRKPSR